MQPDAGVPVAMNPSNKAVSEWSRPHAVDSRGGINPEDAGDVQHPRRLLLDGLAAYEEPSRDFPGALHTRANSTAPGSPFAHGTQHGSSSLPTSFR